MNFQISTGNKDNIGVTRQNGIISFSMQAAKGSNCSLLLYPKDNSPVVKIPMKEQGNLGTVYTVGICGLDWENYDYNFEVNGKEVIDAYARQVTGREVWAEESRRQAAKPPEPFIPKREKAALEGRLPGSKTQRMELPAKAAGKKIKSAFYFSSFRWKDKGFAGVKKEDMVMYKLHIRGFSMGMKGSGRSHGTVEAVERRLGYLKDLGVTTLLFMPVYEFEEVLLLDEGKAQESQQDIINYWGYAAGSYFAPKSSYLGKGCNPDNFKRLVQKMHQNQMECILEFYFPEKTNPHFIIEVFRYWHKEYHVDGFRFIGSPFVAALLAMDRQLCGCKLFYDEFPEGLAASRERFGPELFAYNDRFLFEARKMLNHRGGSVFEFACQMRRQQEHQGFVNYVAENNGFTLWDLFSYEHKHNEQNGEGNRDGSNWNYSGNCGQEGISRKRQVNEARKQQVKNALAATFLSQGVPLLWMGDECGNSQKGNNNAYCQDNEIGWKDWKATAPARQILAFVQQLAQVRKACPMLRSPLPFRLQDYENRGCPDLSYHSDSGWKIDFGMNRGFVGILYSGSYAGIDEDVYVAYNFQSFPQKFALPHGMEWSLFMDTSKEPSIFREPISLGDCKEIQVEGQTVCLLGGKPAPAPRPQKSRKRKR